jgi:hypothetical protein
VNGAVLDLVTGAVIALLGVLVLARPTAAGVVLSRLLGRINMGAPTRAGVLGRGVLFLVIGIALSGIGISFV